jgi:hypothetical protein
MGIWVPRVLSLTTGWVPVSVSVLAVLGLLGWAGWRLRRGFQAIRHGESSVGPVLMGGVRRAAALAGVLLAGFYLSWGLHYSRAPLEVRADLPVVEGVDPEELKTLAAEAALGVNEAYRTLHGSDDAGSPTTTDASPARMSRALEQGWGRIAEPLSLPPGVGGRYGSAKALGVTTWLDLWDLSGVYFPFTGEAHVAGNLPAVALPAVVAHEQGHQRGFARENEATLAGILAALASDDVLVRYSGWSRVVRQFADDLRRADREAWAEFMDDLSPGVKRDWQDLADWYEAHRSLGGPVATAVNDRYLRAHRVPGGVQNYGRVAGLLVSWARSNDGRLDPLAGLAEGADAP